MRCDLRFPHQDRLVHELFEEQVASTPTAAAVVYEQFSLTFASLNSRANQLARYLRHKGVGPDRLVGICVDRSIDMFIALLGILKAGGKPSFSHSIQITRLSASHIY